MSERREWWIRKSNSEWYDIAYPEQLRGELIHVREVPSADEVLKKLDEWAESLEIKYVHSWHELVSERDVFVKKVTQLLTSFGIDVPETGGGGE